MKIMIIGKEGQKYEIPISLNHEIKFEKRHGRGSLQRLYALLARDCRSFVEIGEVFGVTDERIRQIYKQRLAPYLPKKNGNERRRACTLSRIHFSKKGKSFPKHVLEIWRKTKKLGFSVSHVNHALHSKTLPVITISKELLINGKLCKIYRTRTYSQSQPNGPLYAHTTIAPADSYAFLIVVAHNILIAPKTYFIIPKEGFNTITTHKNKRGYMVRSLNLPIIASRHRGDNPWAKYENAWHLLA